MSSHFLAATATGAGLAAGRRMRFRWDRFRFRGSACGRGRRDDPARHRPITPTAGPHWASGGGFSRRFPRPAYQAGVHGTEASRGVPDVAADADAYTGIALVVATATGQYAIGPGAGTSAGAPFWAGLVAIANQYAGRDLGFIDPSLYRIARGVSYHTAFHDVTKGDNTVRFGAVTITGYHAAPGHRPRVWPAELGGAEISRLWRKAARGGG